VLALRVAPPVGLAAAGAPARRAHIVAYRGWILIVSAFLSPSLPVVDRLGLNHSRRPLAGVGHSIAYTDSLHQDCWPHRHNGAIFDALVIFFKLKSEDDDACLPPPSVPDVAIGVRGRSFGRLLVRILSSWPSRLVPPVAAGCFRASSELSFGSGCRTSNAQLQTRPISLRSCPSFFLGALPLRSTPC